MADKDRSGERPADTPAKPPERFLTRGVEDTLVTEFAAEHRSSYGDVLQLKTLLSLQRTFQDPPEPDEMLFLIIHQVSELWLKLMHHQLVEVRRFLRQDDLGPAMKNIDRIKAIQRQLIGAWETLLTMTPADYLTFRDALGNSSGFRATAIARSSSSWATRIPRRFLSIAATPR